MANVTQTDPYRTNTSLGTVMHDDAVASPPTFAALTAMLTDPRLTVERSDVVLALILKERCSSRKFDVPLARTW